MIEVGGKTALLLFVFLFVLAWFVCCAGFQFESVVCSFNVPKQFVARAEFCAARVAYQWLCALPKQEHVLKINRICQKTTCDVHLCARVMLGVSRLAFLLHLPSGRAPVITIKRDQ